MIDKFFSGWKYDWKSALITALLAPVFIYVLSILRRFAKSWGAYAIEGVLYWVNRSLRRSLAGSLTLKRYCRLRLAEDNQYLFVPSSLDLKLEVDKTFVTLTLDHQGDEGQSYDHRNLLGVGSRIRVIGDPGSGKSSLVKRLFRDACHQAIARPSKSRLPLLVELKSLVPPAVPVQDLGRWFVATIRDMACKTRVYRMDECFDAYAENTGILLLLDGLDEVSTANYEVVQRAIVDLGVTLAQMSDSNTIVLTMRTQFHQQIKESFRESFGHALFLKEFTPSDIYRFLRQWPFGGQREHHVARIYGELTDQPTLRDMCRNPLVLAMYVAEDQAVGHVVAPESRTEFYAKVTEELVIKRRLQQTGPTGGHTKLREQRESILGRLAYTHMLDPDQPANSLEWSKAIRIVQEVMHCQRDTAETVFRELSRETGLITEEKPRESLRFIHLTFCEFLAAKEAVQGQKGGWASLVECHKEFCGKRDQHQLRARLLEVIPFACGLLPRVERGTAIADVSPLGDDGLLARCFLETKQYYHPEWPRFAQRRRASLLAMPESRWGTAWLRDLHLFNVVMADAAQCSRHMPVLDANVDLDEFFRSLVGNQRTSVAKLLSAYAAQDAAAAFRLAEVSNLNLSTEFPSIVVDNCDQSPFLSLVLERALSDRNHLSVWASLLAEAGLRSEPVARALSARPSSDEVKRELSDIPRKRLWFRKGMLRECLYTQLISVAVLRGEREPKVLEYLSIVRRAHPPGDSHANLWWVALLPVWLVVSVTEIVVVLGKGDAVATGLPLMLFALMLSIAPRPSGQMVYAGLVGMYSPLPSPEDIRRRGNSHSILTAFLVVNRGMIELLMRTSVSSETWRAYLAVVKLRSEGLTRHTWQRYQRDRN